MEIDIMNPSGTIDIVIPDEIINRIAENESDFAITVKKADPLQSTRNLIREYKNPLTILKRLNNLKGAGDLGRMKILEIGSGNGFFLCFAVKNGLDIVGIEPGKSFGFHKRHEIALELMALNGIMNPESYLFDAVAEALPFEDNTFDIVFSIAVLEHVQDLDMAMKESIRVLKPGGTLFASAPNYNSIWEEHYDIYWIPYMSKKLAKQYIKLFRRNPRLVDDLIFINPTMFLKYTDSPETFGDIYLYGKSGGLFELIKRISLRLNNGFSQETINGGGFKKTVAILVKIKPVALILIYLSNIFLKTLQFFGAARIIHVILFKK